MPDKRILLKNQNLLIWKYILRDSTAIKPGSCFGDIRISLRIAGMLFVKCRCNIFKNCRKTVWLLWAWILKWISQEWNLVESNDNWTVNKIKLNLTQNNTTWNIHLCKLGRNFSCKRKQKSSQLTEAIALQPGHFFLYKTH